MSQWIDIFADAPVREVVKGDILFRRDDPVRSMFLVRSGTVALERAMADGGLLTLHVADKGEALAEASLFAAAYHCDAVVRAQGSVAVLPRHDFLSALQGDPAAAMSLIATHSRAIQAQRARIEILRLKRVADRVDAWLELNGAPQKGGWIDVADQIGVSPPALYRELARRRGGA